MHDEELLYYSLKRIASTIERIINNSQAIDDSQYYVLSPAGMERLESTCMLLLAIGESIKGIDKMTRKQLLPNYPEVDWKGAMGIRDIIAHHYFDIDESIVFDVVKNKLPGMIETINKMIEEKYKHRSSKEQTNMVLPSLDRLSYIHCFKRVSFWKKLHEAIIIS